MVGMAQPGPVITQSTGAQPGPVITQSTGAQLSPVITQSTGAQPGPVITQSTGAQRAGWACLDVVFSATSELSCVIPWPRVVRGMLSVPTPSPKPFGPFNSQ